eukprot:3581642-Rhodomonas_salina.2
MLYPAPAAQHRCNSWCHGVTMATATPNRRVRHLDNPSQSQLQGMPEQHLAETSGRGSPPATYPLQPEPRECPADSRIPMDCSSKIVSSLPTPSA